MDPEQGVVLAGIELVVEVAVVVVGELAGLLCPLRGRVVDYLVAAAHGDGQEAAVLLEQSVDARLLEEFLVVVVDVEGYLSAAVGLVAVAHLEFGRAVAAPHYALCALLVRERAYLHLGRDHEGRVEAQTEVADDGVGRVLVFGKEFLGAGEGNLVDVFVDVLGGHAYAAVGDGEGAFLLVDGDRDVEVAQLALIFAERRERAQLLGGVDGVAHQLAQKNLVVAVQKFLDYRKNVVGGYTNCSFLHIVVSVSL